MLHSKYYKKETKEDPKTSAIFENLILLPDNVFWYIIRKSCYDNNDILCDSGELLYYEFWPHWDSKDTKNHNYVEPDLFLRFNNFDVIIEAKYNEQYGQNEKQWKNEIIAYENEFNFDKSLIFIAVGGNQSTKAEDITINKKKITIYKCSWLSLLINVNKYAKELDCITFPDYTISSLRRLIKNIILAFNVNGVYNINWFDTMAHHPTISKSSNEQINNFFKK